MTTPTVPPEPPKTPPPPPPPEPPLELESEQVGDGLVLERPKRSRWRRLLVWAGSLAAILAALGAAGVGGIFWHYSRDPEIPTFRGLSDYRPPLVTDVYSGDDQLVGEFFTERRRVVPYERIPKQLVQSFIAIEDSRFFDHFGIDPLGMTAAVVDWVRGGFSRKLRGASTLSQQTAKAILVSEWGFEKATARTLRRKIIEMILALRLESLFTKEEILGIYLNHVYLGHHSYGVQSAAENYFRKNVEEMTLGEMTLLAGLPQAPTKYSPYVRPDKAKKRRQLVVQRMWIEGMITESERDAAAAEPVMAYAVEDVFRERSPFFTEHVRRYVVDRYGNDRLLTAGLKVYTTVDVEKQRYAQESMLRGLSEVDKRQGYAGPLAKIPKEDRAEFAGTYDDAVLKGRPLTMGGRYVGLVTRVTSEAATVKVGRHEGLLPLVGMQWARAPDPNGYYPNALIEDCRKALSVGDAILVQRVSREAYPTDNPFFKKVPKDASLLFTLEQEPELQGALVSMDPNSEYVVAMIGGLDFELSEYNRAFQACRQPGSAFKPIVYSAAIEKLEWTPSTILIDAPVVMDDPDNQLRWKPSNYGRDFQGEVILHNALVHSMNVPAVKTLQAVGVKDTIEWAARLGVTTKLAEDLSIALGSSCVTLWDLTNVYALFNRYGKRTTPAFVRRVVDRDGNTLEDRTVYFDPWAPLSERIAAGHAKLYENPEQVIPMATAFLTTRLMHHVVKYGTGSPARRLDKPAAGKTGTTNDSFDAWFMGFTRDLVTGVWIGYDTYAHPMGRYENGGRAALPIWLSYMMKALEGREQEEFLPPNDIASEVVEVDIDMESGKLWDPASTRGKVAVYYRKDTEPEERWGEIVIQQGGYQDALVGDSEL